MLDVQIEGFVKEPDSLKTIDNGQGWMISRALSLKDKKTDSYIAEWFYVAACNQYYYEYIERNSKLKVGYYIQEKFDEDAFFTRVKDDFNKLSFDDWDDFYVKMSKMFEYEDDMSQGTTIGL